MKTPFAMLSQPLSKTAILFTLFFAPLTGVQTVVAQPTDACIDSDGDGWGWDGQNTCEVNATSPAVAGPAVTSAAAICIDNDGDGWGWDGSNSCEVNAAGPAVADTAAVCIDSDGDGWGWDGQNTCQVNAVGPAAVSDTAAVCIDSDGDGWGWDGENTCQTNSVQTNSEVETTSACIDSNGDGWGWDGVQTCIPGQLATVVSPAVSSPAIDSVTPDVLPGVSDPVTSDVRVSSVDEFALHWGGLPLIADISNKRLFLSLGEAFESSNTMTAPLDYRHADAGYSMTINGQQVSAGSELSLSVQHGEVLTLNIDQNNSPFDQYDLVITNLPIVQIFANTIQDEPKLPGTIRWIDGSRDIDTGTMGLGIEYRGATAQLFDKKPFSIEIRDEEGKGANTRLLDLRKDDDWIADAAFRDQSFVRNLVSHDIFRDMRTYAFIDDEGEQKGQSTIAGGLAELILNSSYHGVFVMHERVDRKLLSLKKIDVPEDDTGDRWDLVDFSDPSNGSALYKASTETSDFHSSIQMENEFEQKYPNDDDIAHYQPLYDLGGFIADSTDADFNDRAAGLIEFESVVDWWMLRLLTSNYDGFKKNYYPARSETLQWFIVPWDFDATFGMDWRGGVDPTSDDFYDPARNNLVGRLTANPQNGFNAMAKARWTELRASLFTADAIAARFAVYSDQLDRSSEFGTSPRQRNLQRWPDTGNTGSGRPELADVEYIRDWLVRRLAFVDGKMNDLQE